MSPYDLIVKKRNGGELTKEELAYFLYGYLKGEIPDYQVSAFLMAVYFRGMTEEEMINLTEIMYRSGVQINLDRINRICVDKHSTGGVGDKVSIPLAPLVASAGVPVPMISGRGLGHTGGTLDKLESIPNFRTNLSTEEFINQLERINVVMIGQTDEIAPLDRKLYALRDVTGTVECLPLIVSSILSKKLAEGAHAFVFDVKVGSGAITGSLQEAKLLAKYLVQVCHRFNRRAVSFISNMDQPLGNAIGNALEIEESIELLKGGGPADLKELTLEIGSYMLVLGGVEKELSVAKTKLQQLIDSGKGLEKFRELIEAQGGDVRVIDNPKKYLPQAKYTKEILANNSGFIAKIDTRTLGLSAVNLGAGRKYLDSPIDHSVGIRVFKKVADKVDKGEPIALVYYNIEKDIDTICTIIKEAFSIEDTPVEKQQLIIDILT